MDKQIKNLCSFAHEHNQVLHPSYITQFPELRCHGLSQTNMAAARFFVRVVAMLYCERPWQVAQFTRCNTSAVYHGNYVQLQHVEVLFKVNVNSKGSCWLFGKVKISGAKGRKTGKQLNKELSEV